LFSGIGVAAVPEFDQYSQALLRGQRRVISRIGLAGILKIRKNLDRFLHTYIIRRDGFKGKALARSVHWSYEINSCNPLTI
jgi:hypothetical protein